MIDKLVLGTAQFGQSYGVANENGILPPDDVCKILSAALEAGISYLDTAISYGDSESIIGGCGLQGWRVITKLPHIPTNLQDIEYWVLDQIEKSMARLRVDRLEAVLLHSPDQLLSPHGALIVRALIRLKERGFTKKIGISIYGVDILEDLSDTIELDIVQGPLSVLDRRLITSGWAQRLDGDGVEVHARSIFLQGLLLMGASRIPDKFRRWDHQWSFWQCWVEANGLSPIEACLRGVLGMPGIRRVIFGVDNLRQLEEVIASAKNGPLSSLPMWPNQADDELINPTNWSRF